MVVDDQGRIEGSLTGGCVEGNLVETAGEVLAGSAPQLKRYGLTDDHATDIGLMCGGTVSVFVAEMLDQDPVSTIVDEVDAGRPVALVTMLDGPSAGARLAITGDGVSGSLGRSQWLDENVEQEARGYLDQARSTIRRFGVDGETVGGAEIRVAVCSFASPPRLLIFGAVDFSVALAHIAKSVGFRVTIVDARPAFTNSPRFAADATVVTAWPDAYLAGQSLGPRDAVVVFTHDPKFDEPALIGALQSTVGYIGALGSRRTVVDRASRLNAKGVSIEDLTRISSPCGLDIGARTPQETAVSILAEMLTMRSGRDGRRLTSGAGPIRGRATPDATQPLPLA
jgi:xanthine dehydrogenase accessory factor